MAKRKRITNQTVIKKRICMGDGQGEGSNYKPWLKIQDVPSDGLVHRIKGWKTKRVHHFLSNLELNYFYVLEWSPVVFDIREQYPLLPLEETLAIAEQCDILHPTDPKTKEPIVMTTDFLLTVPQTLAVIQQARTIKTAETLQSQRTLEKLEIERRYWHNRNIDWAIATEREIPQVLVKNVHYIHPFFHARAENLSFLSDPELCRIATALTRRIAQENVPLTDLTAECEDKLGLQPGTALSVVRHLIATRKWLVDMNIPIQPRRPLVFLTVPSVESYQTAGGVG